jgi:PKHD-type hydroxylase
MDYRWFLNGATFESHVYAKDFFTPEECKQIIAYGKNEKYSTKDIASVGGAPGSSKYKKAEDLSYRRSKISWLRSDYEETRWIFERITSGIVDINSQFFNFDLDHIENIQFTEYEDTYKGFYGKHIDIAYKSSNMRKLSFTIQLSDPSEYDGGDLCLYFSDDARVMAKDRGILTVFPSFAVHEVEPVTRGTRYALVGWVCGPPFR